MKRKYSPPGLFGHEGVLSKGHLTDEAILRSLDGELSTKEVIEVDAHIQSCWSCRGRRRAIEEEIAALVDYQNAVTAPYLPPASDEREIFLIRLNALAAKTTQPFFLNVLWSRFKRAVGFDQTHQLVWITSVLLLALMLPCWYLLRTPPVVSANELLNRTVASQAVALKETRQPVIVQKLKINVGRASIVRTIYRDVENNRTSSRTDRQSVGESLAKATYVKSALDWDSVLDGSTYRHWRAGHPRSVDRVVRVGNDELMLETTSSGGPVTEADLTVRIKDYHAVSETFHLQDHSEIEIAELSYDVIPFVSVPADIFGVSVRTAVAMLPAAKIVRSAVPNDAELADAEIKTDSALHGLGADLGEQINLRTNENHELSVEGIVSDDNRKQQIVSALQSIPNTRLHILTIDEAAQQAQSSAANRTDAASSPSVVVVPTATPLLETQLNARFTDKDSRIQFVNQALSLAQSASARAWALNRLADRYPPHSVAVLDDEDRRKLQVLLTDHVSALSQDISSLQNQMGEVLSGSSNTPAANTSVNMQLRPGVTHAVGISENWRDRIHRIHSSTETVHEAVTTLLSSSPTSDQNDIDSIQVNLRTSLTQLQTELQALDQIAHEADLK